MGREKNTLPPAGQKIGRWTITDTSTTTPRGEVKRLCRCECGTERYVLERSLKSGASLSCGCMRKENAQKALGMDLQGKTFGELTVIRKADYQRKNGGIWWLCRCSCGKEYETPGTLLTTGRRIHCNSDVHEKNYASTDITGQKFRQLTALYPTQARDSKGSVMWHCCCECGNEVDVSYNNLLYSNIKSCGCKKKEHDQNLKRLLTHVAGTSVDMLKSKKVPKDNTSGYRGVYFIRGRYTAKIVFQKKVYYLGTYEKVEEALRARREAEEILFDQTAEYYAQWRQWADRAPEWAERNPVQIVVTQDEMKRLSITFLPELPKV